MQKLTDLEERTKEIKAHLATFAYTFSVALILSCRATLEMYMFDAHVPALWRCVLASAQTRKQQHTDTQQQLTTPRASAASCLLYPSPLTFLLLSIGTFPFLDAVTAACGPHHLMLLSSQHRDEREE